MKAARVKLLLAFFCVAASTTAFGQAPKRLPMPGTKQAVSQRIPSTRSGYTSIKLHRAATGHLYMDGTINGVKGTFLVDSGAGASLVNARNKQKFKLTIDNIHPVVTAGVGSSGFDAKLAPNNELVLGNYKVSHLTLLTANIDHFNNLAKLVGVAAFDGIVGADILFAAKAIIDYSTLTLHLRPMPQ